MLALTAFKSTLLLSIQISLFSVIATRILPFSSLSAVSAFGRFIVTTSFVKETGVDINRPNAETAERDEKGNILVAITENNEIWIDKRRVDLKAVRANIERLKIEYPGGSVIIQADQLSKSGLLVETMDQIRLAGIQNISIAAKNDS
jgi:biopolymer transport protein ExbD